MAYAYTPEDITNMALSSIGYPRPIGDIYEGSPAARVAVTYYAQTRDALMQRGDWPFCLREVALTAVPAQTPPSPWLNEYIYPTDCLRIRYVRPGPLTGGTRNNDPQPVLFRAWNDNRAAPPVLSILCDLAAPVLIYNGRVTNPATWTPNFLEALVSELAEKLSFGLFKSAEVIKGRAMVAQETIGDAMKVDDDQPPRQEVMSRGDQR